MMSKAYQARKPEARHQLLQIISVADAAIGNEA